MGAKIYIFWCTGGLAYNPGGGIIDGGGGGGELIGGNLWNIITIIFGKQKETMRSFNANLVRFTV